MTWRLEIGTEDSFRTSSSNCRQLGPRRPRLPFISVESKSDVCGTRKTCLPSLCSPSLIENDSVLSQTTRTLVNCAVVANCLSYDVASSRYADTWSGTFGRVNDSPVRASAQTRLPSAR